MTDGNLNGLSDLIKYFPEAVIPLLVAVLAVFLANHLQQRERRKAEKKMNLQVRQSLYVELFSRVARCARDAYTWHPKNTDAGIKKDRKIYEFMKFAPSLPIIYPSLGRDHGLLPSGVAASLGEFYYRLDAVNRDQKRFSRLKAESSMCEADKKHFAQVLWEACESGSIALKEFHENLESAESLDERLNDSHARFFQDHPPIGNDIKEALTKVIAMGNPNPNIKTG